MLFSLPVPTLELLARVVVPTTLAQRRVLPPHLDWPSLLASTLHPRWDAQALRLLPRCQQMLRLRTDQYDASLRVLRGHQQTVVPGDLPHFWGSRHHHFSLPTRPAPL